MGRLWNHQRKAEGFLLGAVVFCCCNAIAVRCAASPLSRGEPAGLPRHPHPRVSVESDTAPRHRGWNEKELPTTFGMPVAVGNKLYVNFSRDEGYARLMEVIWRIKFGPRACLHL